MFVRRLLLLGALGIATACGAASSGDEPATTADTGVSIGALPPTLPTVFRTTTSTEATTTTLPAPPTIGDLVTGNRVIVIGDSIMASASRRLGGELCDTLVPMGWAIEVDAEPGRRIQFGNEVLDTRLGVGWDAAVVFLGNNYVAVNPDYFEASLERIIERLSPRPIVLFTVTLVSEKKVAVNAMIRQATAKHDNLVILDWEAFTLAHPEILRTDGLHLTDDGRQVFTDQLALVLGTAPTSTGECLGTNFFDDSGMPAD